MNAADIRRVGIVGGGQMGAGIAESLYDEFKEPLYAPPPLLLRMVEAGLLGRRTGHGFPTYDRAERPGSPG